MENNRERFKKRYENFLREGKLHKTEDALENEVRFVSETVPADVLCDIAEGDYCKLCACDSDVRKASCYGMTDLGHEQPAEQSTSKFGTVLPITVRVCKRCRRNYRLVQYLPTAVGMLIAVAALIIICMPSVNDKILEADFVVPVLMRPFCIFAITLALAILLCTGMRRLLIEKLSKKTVFNIFDVRGMEVLKETGWKKLYQNKHFSEILFSDYAPCYMRSEQTDTCVHGDCCHECECEREEDETEQ